MVHPQDVIEIVLLCIIFNQKIHLENPRAELQLRAQHSHSRPQGGGWPLPGSSSASPQGWSCGGRREARDQADSLTLTLQTNADHPAMASGVPLQVPQWMHTHHICTHVNPHVTAMHPVTAEVLLTPMAMSPASRVAVLVLAFWFGGSPLSYLLVAVVLENCFQKGFGPFTQHIPPSRSTLPPVLLCHQCQGQLLPLLSWPKLGWP